MLNNSAQPRRGICWGLHIFTFIKQQGEDALGIPWEVICCIPPQPQFVAFAPGSPASVKPAFTP